MVNWARTTGLSYSAYLRIEKGLSENTVPSPYLGGSAPVPGFLEPARGSFAGGPGQRMWRQYLHYLARTQELSARSRARKISPPCEKLLRLIWWSKEISGRQPLRLYLHTQPAPPFQTSSRA